MTSLKHNPIHALAVIQTSERCLWGSYCFEQVSFDAQDKPGKMGKYRIRYIC